MKTKRILTLLLAVLMVMSLLPISVLAAEEEPVEASVEEAPVEEAPVEEAPVEEAPVEEAPAEEAPVEEAPVEEAPVEEAPVEEAPVEEAPVEEAPVEEAPVEEAPAEEAPAEEAPVEEPEDTTYVYDYVPSQVSAANVYEAIVGEPMPVGTSVTYLARESGATLDIELSDIFDADWLVEGVANVIGSTTITVPLGEVWADVTADYSVPVDPIATVRAAFDNLKWYEYGNVTTIAAKALADYGCHSFGTQETETVKIGGTPILGLGADTVSVKINDLRTPTYVTGTQAQVVYGYTTSNLLAAMSAKVFIAGGDLLDAEIQVINGDNLDVGEHTVTLYYAGDDYYKPSTATVRVKVTRAYANITYTDTIVEQGSDYSFVLNNSTDVEAVEFMIGTGETDACVMIKVSSTFAGALELYKQATGKDAYAQTLSVGDAIAMLMEAGDVIQQDDESLQQLLDGLDAILEKLGLSTSITVKFVNEFHPTDAGVYIAAASITSANYYFNVALGTLVIYPDGKLATIDWVDHDYNGIVLRPLYDDFDLTAVASDADLQDSIEYLFLGVDPGAVENGECCFFVETDPAAVKARQCAAFTELAYVAPSCEESRLILPAYRALAVVPAHLTMSVVDTSIPYTTEYDLADMIDFGCEDCDEKYILLVQDGDTVNVILTYSDFDCLSDCLPDTLVDVDAIASVLEDAANNSNFRYSAAVVDALVKNLRALDVQKVLLNGAAPTELGEYTVTAIGYSQYHYADSATGTLTLRYPKATVSIDLPDEKIDLAKEETVYTFDVVVKDENGNELSFEDLPITVEGLDSSYADGKLTVDFKNAVVGANNAYAVTVAADAVQLDGIWYELDVTNGVLYTYNSNFATIIIGKVAGEPGETVYVPVSVGNNPGFRTFSLGIDMALDFEVESKACEVVEALGIVSRVSGSLFMPLPAEFTQENVELFVLKVTIPEDAEIGQEYPVEIKSGSLVAGKMQFNYENGSITVVDNSTPVDPDPDPEEPVYGLLGDVNDDTVADVNDATMILQYYVNPDYSSEIDLTFANVNNSEEIDVNDATLILQYYVTGESEYPIGKNVVIDRVDENNISYWKMVGTEE